MLTGGTAVGTHRPRDGRGALRSECAFVVGVLNTSVVLNAIGRQKSSRAVTVVVLNTSGRIFSDGERLADPMGRTFADHMVRKMHAREVKTKR